MSPLNTRVEEETPRQETEIEKCLFDVLYQAS